MIDKNLITKLVDFFLENDSPAIVIAKGKRRTIMGSNYAHPPLEHLIHCISYICRMHSFIDLTPPNQQPAMLSFLPKHSVFTLTNPEIPHDQILPIKFEDIYMLT